MKKFKFQLETLLKVTRRKKDEAEMQFAEVSRRLEEQRAQLQVFLGELQVGQAEFANRTSAGKTITVDVIVTYNNFFNWKREQIEQQQQLILKTMQERQQKLKKLTDLMTYVCANTTRRHSLRNKNFLTNSAYSSQCVKLKRWRDEEIERWRVDE